MPSHYLLTLYDADGDATTTPYEAPDNLLAVADALGYAHHLGQTFAGIRRMTVEELVIGRYNPQSGLIETRPGARLYDSNGTGLTPDPDDDPDPDEIDQLRARISRLENQVSVLRNDLDEACSGTTPPIHHGHGDCSRSRGLIPIGVAAAIEHTRFSRVPDEPESIPFLAS